MKTLIQAKYQCGTCGKYFQDGFEFPEKYYCEEDSEFWDKDEGRNCPSCHKFGKNPDGLVCPDCSEEVEEVNAEVDPDDEIVISADGDEIVPQKKTKARKVSEDERTKSEAERKKRCDEMGATLKKDASKHKISDPDLLVGLFSSDIVVAAKKIRAIDSAIVIYASVAVSHEYQYDGSGLPFSVEFRISSNGFKGKYRSDGGFCFQCGKSEDFATVDELVEYAKKRIGEVG